MMDGRKTGNTQHGLFLVWSDLFSAPPMDR